MSHFVTLVTNVNEEPLDAQLERFNEQGDEWDYFMEKEYYIKRDKKEITQWLDNELKNCDIAIADKDRSEENKEWWIKEKATVEKILQEKDLSKQLEAIQEIEGGCLDDKGLYFISNPNAKWDWWTEGGRWDGWLVKKDGTRCNSCVVKELDLEGMRKAELEDRAKWYDEEIARAKADNRKPVFWEFDNVPTKEEYVKKGDKPVAPYAVLHDDNWFEKGAMGWWGIDDPHCTEEQWAEWFDEFINKLDPEMEIAIVDCHI